MLVTFQITDQFSFREHRITTERIIVSKISDQLYFNNILRAVVFSERELMFMFAICRRPSVCRLSVCRLSSVCNVRAPYSAG